jgi:hypothetical protein
MSDEVYEQLRELLGMAVIQGRIEGIVAATNTIGGFIDLAEKGDIGDDWLDQLRILRSGMTDILLRAEFDNTERIRNV